MHTGLHNQESVAQVLRNVSQRRRHGLLELRFADSQVRIHFAQGKIVEVSAPELNPIEEATRALLEAGYLSEVPADLSSYSKLSEAVLLQNRLERAEAQVIVRRAVRHGALSRLYALDLNAPAFTNFDASMVEYERDFAPALSIGQLLLDVVALPADRPHFIALFGGNVLLSQGEKEPSSLSDEEELLYEILKKEQPLQDLRRRSMLSEFPLQDGLLRLHEQGCVAVREAPRQEGLREELLGSELLTDLDASIDQVFESEGLKAAASELAAPPSQVDDTDGAQEVRAVTSISIATEASASPSFVAGLRQRFALSNARAIHTPWAPALVMVLFLIACGLVPLFLWHRVFEAFAG